MGTRKSHRRQIGSRRVFGVPDTVWFVLAWTTACVGAQSGDCVAADAVAGITPDFTDPIAKSVSSNAAKRLGMQIVDG